MGYKFKKDDDFSLAFSSFHIFCWPFLLFQLSDHTFLSPAGQKECSKCFGLDLKNIGLSILVGKKLLVNYYYQDGFWKAGGTLSLIETYILPNHFNAMRIRAKNSNLIL